MNIQFSSDNAQRDIHSFKWMVLLALFCFLSYLGVRAYIVNSNMHAYSKSDTYFVYAFKAPDILLMQAKKLVKTQPASAKKTLNDAYRADLTSAMPLLLMAQKYQKQGQLEQVHRLITLGEQLNPRHTQYQLALGQFWGQQQRLDLAFSHWSQALDTRPSLGKKLFPVFLTMAESGEYQSLFFRKQSHTPQWLDSFFGYALSHSSSINTIRQLARQYQHYGQAMPADIKGAYLDKLIQTGLWTEAYFDWVNSLNSSQTKFLGNVNDGGFEVEMPSDGFAWRYASTKGVQLSQSSTFGMTGERALRVQFLGSAVGAVILAEQKLFLSPANYALYGRARAENMRLYKGAHWQVICEQGGVIAKTTYFQQDMPWSDFKTSFTIPMEGCSGQALQLVLENALDRDQIGMYGTLWFDDVVIELMGIQQ